MANTFRPSGIRIAIRQSLAEGASRTGTTLDVDPIITKDGHRVTMTDVGDIMVGKIDEGTDNEEIITWTGMTDNTSYYTLTGVVWGYNFYNTTGDVNANKKRHDAGAELIITNDDHFLAMQYPNKDNDLTIGGTWTFTDPNYPKIDDDTAGPTDDEQFATKKYVDDTATGSTNVDKLVSKATAGETVAAGEVVYFDETAKEWKLADASATGTSENVLLGIARGAGTDGNLISGGVLLYGLDANQSGFTAGDIIYLSDTAGTLASSAGTKEVIVGYAHSATEIFFAPINFKYNPTKDEQDAMAGTSGTPSSSNKYVTNDDTRLDTVINSQIFTSSGTWTKPSGVTFVEVVVLGAGGGGGSGRKNTLSQNTCGGAGSGGGAVSRAIFKASSLGATETVTVGTGGTGGAAVTVNGVGNDGTDGGASSFGTWLTAGGGGKGTGGPTGDSDASGGGGGGVISSAVGSTGGSPQAGTADAISGQGPSGSNSVSFNSEVGGGSGGYSLHNDNGSDGGSSIFASGGGGGGAGIPNTDVVKTGGAGGDVQSYTEGGGGAAGTNGQDNADLAKGFGGSGGGGGDSSLSTGETGGDGGVGAGGGGGGASRSGNSGAGGAGGRGEVRVYSW